MWGRRPILHRARPISWVISLAIWQVSCAPGVYDSTTPHKKTLISASQNVLHVSPDPTVLGAIRPGQSATASLTLRNPQADAVIVEQVETSCYCVRVTPASFRIAPDEDVELTVTFDSSKEPNFRGGLSVQVAGKGRDDVVLFRTLVELTVRPAPPATASGEEISAGADAGSGSPL